MTRIENLISLRDYCRKNKWPRLPQWNFWITERKQIALQCVRRVENRYMIDLEALETYLANATLDKVSHDDQPISAGRFK